MVEHISSLLRRCVPRHSSALTTPTSGPKSHFHPERGSPHGGAGGARVLLLPKCPTTSATTVPSAAVASATIDANEATHHSPSSGWELCFAPGEERAGRKHASLSLPLAFPFVSSPPHRTPSHVRRNEATFALREAGLLLWLCSRERSDLSRDSTPDLCARETPLLPFPWLAARRPHGKAGAPVRAGRGASGSDSPAGSACRGTPGRLRGAAPPPGAAATCERQARTCLVGTVREPRLGQVGGVDASGAPESGAGVF